MQATVGSHCVDCTRASRPSTTTRARDWNARQPVLVTYALIAVNAAVFVWVLLGSSRALGSRVTAREFDLGLNKAILEATGEWYRLVTSGFLHFGIFHLAMNMFLLYQLGQLIEPAIGRVRFALVYAASLLGGSAGVLVLQGDSLGLHGGASGAVFGLMGAAAVGLHRRGVNIFQTGIGLTLLLNLVITFTIPGISIGGHIGGIVAGVLCGIVVLAPGWKRFPLWATYVAPSLVALAAVGLSVAVVG
ncbi:MAG: rhomboid family intramembrane serine protease [Actinomycetota bacterium]|nr:MAG: rhomboid family intramembrane serine protease [Actinomycetota bacterium]